MKHVFAAGLIMAAFSMAVLTVPAQASCRDTGTCAGVHKVVAKVTHKKPAGVSARKVQRTVHARRHAPASGGRDTGAVVGMIKSMAPGYGVPAWFALRIAKVESNYNPRARGSAGELGVFQLKCATARGIGYRGSCAGLLNARTNVQYGLKHLSLAIRSSRGNLHLAASKHNGGLGRKKLVRGYVAMVF